MNPAPLKLFISYSHRDDAWRRKLDVHLSQLRRERVFDIWHDRCLVAGERWETAIDERLADADVVLLLVSADFLDSRYAYGVEMTQAFEQSKQGRTRVVPVILHDCEWNSPDSPLGKLQALPRNGVAISSMPARKVPTALTQVAQGLRKLAKQLRKANGAQTNFVSPPVACNSRNRWLVACAAALVLLGTLALISHRYGEREVDLGNRELRVGEYARAEQHFAAAERYWPLSAAADAGRRFVALGKMIPSLGEPETLGDFTRLLRQIEDSHPQDAQVWFFRGLRDFNTGRATGDPQLWAEAAPRAFAKASELDPLHSEAYAQLAFLFNQTCQPQQALRFIEQALESGSEVSRPGARYRLQLASILVRIGTADSLARANQIFEAQNQQPLALAEQALLSWQTGDWERAASQLAGAESLLASDPQREVFAWSLPAGTEMLLLGETASQRCLVRYARAVTAHLQQVTDADTRWHAVTQDCERLLADARFLLCAQLSTAAAAKSADVAATRAWLQCRHPSQGCRAGQARLSSESKVFEGMAP
jgi:tetratricopeptide (TPR) repeat protein